MGLLKSIETAQGVETTYHNINVFKNTADRYLEISVNSYINAEKRNGGALPLVRRNMTVPLEFWKGDNAEPTLEKAGYAYLMTLKEFEGAENDEN